MKVISISTDRKIFETGSAVQMRQIEYGGLFEELHVVVFCRRGAAGAVGGSAQLGSKVQIAPNTWLYPTHSWSKFLYVLDARRIAANILKSFGLGVRAHDSNNLQDQSVTVTTQDPFETGLVGVWLKKHFSVRLHVQVHTDFLSPFFAQESFLNWLRVRIARKVLPRADAVRVVSERIKNSLLTAKLTKVQPVVLPIFVDIGRYEQAVVLPEHDLRKKYPQFNFIILMASRLTKEKNIPFALQMFKKLLAVYPRAGLVVVGDGKQARELRSLAAKLGIASQVVFEQWTDNIVAYYKTAHVFLITSAYEGYGMTIVEAIASHCPVISADVGVARSVLQYGQTSPICAVGDEACFLDQLSKLIEQPAMRDHIVFEARNRLSTVAEMDKQVYLQKYAHSIVGSST